MKITIHRLRITNGRGEKFFAPTNNNADTNITSNTDTIQPVNCKKRLISRLINDVLYFFDFVLIILENKRFRLPVIHKNRILFDKHFKTPRGARIAFEKLFNEKKVILEKAEWSPLYKPEPGKKDVQGRDMDLQDGKMHLLEEKWTCKMEKCICR